MGKARTYLSAFARVSVFVALLQVSAIGQTFGPGLAAEKPREDMAALSSKALAGDTQAQLQLGIAYEFGQGVDKNLDEAMYWYHVAADRADPVAQTNLAYLYKAGAAGSGNESEAAKWYLRAAVSGFVRAKFNLAFSTFVESESKKVPTKPHIGLGRPQTRDALKPWLLWAICTRMVWACGAMSRRPAN